MRILLTGAAGFLGSALAKRWVQVGHQLTLLVRPTTSLRRVESLLPTAYLARCTSDSDIAQLVHNTRPDVIVHTACVFGRQGETALQLFDANVRLGVLLLDSAIRGSSGLVAFVNTCTVLDFTVNNYALSKWHFLQWGDAQAQQNPAQLQFVNVRLQHMYGPGDHPSKFTSHVLHACRRHQPQLALTAGEQCRDFIYIDDVVSAFDLVVQKLNEFSGSDSIDVGSGDAPPLRSYVETVHALTNSRTELHFGAIPYRRNEAMLCQADTSRLKNLGWNATYNLEQGIKRTIELEFDL